jgi:O-antigen/teichoic acid export membrane protein
MSEVHTQNSSNKSNEDSKAQGYMLKTLKNTSMVVVVSILTKIVNLVCNIFLARKISKHAYGIAKVYLEFAFLLLLYFPRETIRKSAQKFCPHHENEELEEKNFKQTVQLYWMLDLLFLILSIPLYLGFVFFSGEALDDLHIHLIIYIISANIELIVEPVIIYMNMKIENNNKLAAATLGNYTRVLSNCLFAYLFGFDLLSFTLSRILASGAYVSFLIYCAIYKYKLDSKTLLPDFGKIKKMTLELFKKDHEHSDKETQGELDPKLKEIFLSFVRTNILKMILTYTEKMILSFYLDFSESDKAEYSFVVDNFAIIIRYFLEPTEESFYNLINKVKTKKSDENKNEKKDTTFNLLKLCIRFMSIFGILMFAYIQISGKEVITLVFTEKWGNPSTFKILKFYSLYVGIISINGIVEAYSNAMYSSAKMNTYNLFMIINSTLLIFLCIFLTKYEIIGLIYANSIMMILRIGFNVHLILSETKGEDNSNKYLNFIKSCSIKFSTLASTLLCVIILNYLKQIEIISSKNFFVVSVTGVVFLINVFLIYLLEKRNFRELMKMN